MLEDFQIDSTLSNEDTIENETNTAVRNTMEAAEDSHLLQTLTNV
jgi:hypothetical protein